MSIPVPSPTLTPGLDFSNVQLGKDHEILFKAQVTAARQILEEKLQTFQELQCAFKLTLAEGDFADSPIFIDARSTPVRLLDAAPVADSDLSFELALQPEKIEQLHTGFGEDCQTTIFMSASARKGNVNMAIRFADLLTPIPSVEPPHAEKLNIEELPAPTEDVEQVKRDIRRWGYGMLKNALSPEQVDILKKAVQEQAAGERDAGLATFDGGPKKANQRVWNLVNKGDEFLDLMNHPAIDRIIAWFLGDNPLLWSYNANIARPGGDPQVLHWDSGVMGAGRHKPVAMNISWFLCDVTEANGGTRIFPASHQPNTRPRNPFSSEGSIAAQAPAGTALIFEGRVWHGTGRNTETTGERPVILSLFCNKSIRPKENCLLSLDWEVEERLSERLKSMCQLRTSLAGIGGMSGESRGGLVLRRPRGDEHKMVGKLRAPHDESKLVEMMVNGNHAENEASQAREASKVEVTGS